MKLLLDRARSIVSDERLRASVRGLWDRLGWGEFVTLGAILICSGGLYAFAEIADDTFEGETKTFDRQVITMLRTSIDPEDPVGPDWLEVVFRDLTALGGYPIVTTIAVLVVGYLALLRRWGMILLVVISLAGGTILNTVLKDTFDRPRPDLVAHLVEFETASFPSGHAMLSAVAYLTIGALLAQVQPRRRMKIYVFVAAVLLTLLIGFSRVYLGVHWPTDVLAGWCIGAAWAMACWLVSRSMALWRGPRGVD